MSKGIIFPEVSEVLSLPSDLTLEHRYDLENYNRKGPGIISSRASGATQFNSHGQLVWAPENLLTRSEELNNAAWLKTRATVTANSQAAPDGVESADKIVVDSTASATHAVQSPAFSFVSGQEYMFSVFVRAGEYSRCSVVFSPSAFLVDAGANFELTGNGSVALEGAGLSSASIIPLDGWYRISITATANASASVRVIIYLDDGTGGIVPVFTGNGTSGIFAWGAQLQRFPNASTDYIPTTSSPVYGVRTRSHVFTDGQWINAGVLVEGQSTNLNSNFNANPTDTTGMLLASSGATLTIVNDAAALAAAGLSGICSSGNVYCLDTSAASGVSTLTLVGQAGVLTPVTVSAWVRQTAPGNVQFSAIGQVSQNISPTEDYSRLQVTFTPTVETRQFGVRVAIPGPIIYFILNQVEVGEFTTSPIVVSGSAVTRSADVISISGGNRTNLCLNSDAINESSWTSSGATRLTASELITTNNTSVMALASNLITCSAGFYTRTSEVKFKGRRWIQLRTSIDLGAGYVNFDIVNGIVGTQSGATGTITPLEDGWFRVTFTQNCLAGTGDFSLNIITDNTAVRNSSTTGDGVLGVFVRKTQIEIGSVSTNYIPTISSSVTRSDVFDSFYNQQEGTWILESENSNLDGSASMYINSGSVNESLRIGVPSAGTIQVLSRSNANTDGALNLGLHNAGLNKIATSYQLNNLRGSRNSGSVWTDNSSIVPKNIIQAQFGISHLGAYLNGHIKSLKYYNKIKTNDFLQKASSYGYDSDAYSYFARVESIGGSFNLTSINSSYTASYIKSSINAFVIGCKTDNIWSKLTEIYLLSGVSFNGLFTKLKFSLTPSLSNNGFVGSDFVIGGSGAGLVGNGSTKRIACGINRTDTHNISLSAYVTFPQTNTINAGYIGASTAAPAGSFLGRGINGGSDAFSNGEGTSQYASQISASRNGFFVGSSRSQTDRQLYRNGSSIATNTVSAPNSTQTLEFSLFSFNGTTNVSNARLSFAHIGTGLTTQESVSLSSRVNTLMTSIGANVY
jgi:hypothetical protein